MIFDSDIAIWMLRGDSSALEFARACPPDQRTLSVISHLELLQGCRDQREQQALEELLSNWFGEIAPLDAGISRRAVSLIREFGLSHRPSAADALIAATALQAGETLATGNVKHFRFVPGLAIRPFQRAV
jgi:predicted nucleic acid-binding protein